MENTAQAEIEIAGKQYRLSPLTAGEFIELGRLLVEISETRRENFDRSSFCTQAEKLLQFVHASVQRVQPDVSLDEIRKIPMPDLPAVIAALTRISTPKSLAVSAWIQ